MLAVSGLYVALTERHRALPDVELLSFNSEPACWRWFTGTGGELVVLKPDAAVQVGIGDLALSTFVEIDLGTESLPTIQKKCERYIAYWCSGVEQQRTKTADAPRGVFPLVVWLVPDTHRKSNIARVLGRLGLDAAGLFTVALLTDGSVALTTIPATVSGLPSGGAEPRAPP
jgi:hypothetical protein